MANTKTKAPNMLGGGANNPLMQRLFAQLYTPENIKSYVANNELADDVAANFTNLANTASANPLSGKPVMEGFSNTGAGTTARLGMNMIKDHPVKAGGAAILGGINTAGLFDNSEIAGQVIGGVAGGVIPAIAGANPYTSAMISMIGGGLGSLYDKLVAKKKQEEAMQQQMYNNQGVY